MSDATLCALVVGGTERILLMLGWDKVEEKKKKDPRQEASRGDAAYQKLKKNIHNRARNKSALFQEPKLKPITTVQPTPKQSEWTDATTSAFDVAVTGTV